MTTTGSTDPAFRTLRGNPALASAAGDVLASLAVEHVAERMAERDHTLWRSDPAEISNRLGWLDLPTWMPGQLERIRELAGEVSGGGNPARDSGRPAAPAADDVLLLGMGGSSLAPEVFRQIFGDGNGRPRLHVLDTTSPSAIRAVTSRVDPSSVHVLVASKSGTTIEVATLFDHFWEVIARSGEASPGRCFTAITDPGTPLVSLASEKGFRATFENPADIGGRYSALSFFGLVPAGLLGVDLPALLARATAMADRCAPGADPSGNPGCVLGALLGAAARNGRDKLTLVPSPALEPFGLWVEQLLAESTGKDGLGVVPVTGEPWTGVASFGTDRLFVSLALAGDDSEEHSGRLEKLESAGHPVWRIELDRTIDLGAEMFRWEYATAVCGHVLGVHPFDQPDVQAAKARANEVLGELSGGAGPKSPDPGDAGALLRGARTGDYLVLMVYGNPDSDVLAAVAELRAAVQERARVATTFGLGPRFLHSTGQLHKGGPGSVIAIQLVLDEGRLPIPGRSFGFQDLIGAQATGDLLALREAGRRAARVDGSGPNGAAGALRSLADALP